ncbi:MAG: hypothetical protein LBV12_06690, partial [Puniceicoccales bacterium]|nr:hypothetical protein [Puniceicoccales bacterium]
IPRSAQALSGGAPRDAYSQPPLTQCSDSSQATPSLRLNIDFLKHLYQYINQPSTLTLNLDHIG